MTAFNRDPVARTPKSRPPRSVNAVIAVVLLVYCGIMGAVRYGQIRREAPSIAQQIVATMASWGMPLDGVSVLVEAEETERRKTQLLSPVSEERVRAAYWLVARGLRSTGPQIAAAMADAGTLRPCQLAHSLGGLGDPRWTRVLSNATRHGSADLRTCATRALGKIGSSEAAGALMEAYRDPATSVTALWGLGNIADPATLPFLERVASSPRNMAERRSAETAVERIRLLKNPDPVAALCERLRGRSNGDIDLWALRKIACFRDPRAVPLLRQMLAQRANASDAELIPLAAALLAVGPEGVAVLQATAQAPGHERAGQIAAAALGLRSEPPPEWREVTASVSRLYRGKRPATDSETMVANLSDASNRPQIRTNP